MKKRTATLAIALPAILAIGLVLLRRTESVTEQANAVPATPQTVLEEPTAEIGNSKEEDIRIATLPQNIEANTSLSPYFIETIGTITHLAGELSLDMNQSEELSQIYQATMLEKAEIEEGLIELKQRTNFTATYIIPAYPEKGIVLRESFFALVEERLGEDIANAIQSKYSQNIDSSFSQFGQADQVITATAGLLENGGKLYSLEIDTYLSKDAIPLKPESGWLSSSIVKQYFDLDNSPWSYLAPQLKDLAPSPKS